MILEILNNDCLLHIFKFLPIVDRVRTEVVCKRWRALSQESWRRMTRLDNSYLTWGVSTYGMNIVMLQKVLEKCGRFLKQIHVPNIYSYNINKELCPYNYNKKALDIVLQYCPSLTSIDISEIMICVKNIAKQFRSSTEFLQECSKLNYFEVRSNIYVSGILLYLPAQTIRTLIIKRCCRLDDTKFSMGLAKLKNVECLKIWVSFIGEKTMKVISNCCTNLKELQIHEFVIPTGSDRSERSADMLKFINLVNLQVLKVTHFPLSEEHFTSIALNCLQITTLDISGSFYVNDAALIALTALPKLEYLYISYLPGITSYGLKDVKNLKEFVCRGCTSIADNGILKVLISSPQLRLLDLTYCNRITFITYQLANIICDIRPSKMILKMHIYGTQISITNTFVRNPLLHIIH